MWYASATGSITLIPWLGLFLRDAGFDEGEVAALLLALPIGRLVGGPAWAWIADRAGPDRIVRLGATGAALCASALLGQPAPGLMVAAIVGWALSRAPLFPLLDAHTIADLGHRYGPIRSLGSVAFLGVALAGGLLRDRFSEAPLILAIVLLWVTVLASFALPPLIPRARPDPAPDGPRLRRHRLALLLLGCVLHGASLSSYDQLFSVHVDALGLPAIVTGSSLALGVGVEIVVLAAAPWLLARLGPHGLMGIGVACGVPRFLITGTTHSPALLVAAQALHGLHFGAFWVAGVTLFADMAPGRLRNSTQALLPASAFGAGPLLGLSLATVVLREHSTHQLYLLMACCSALATGALALLALGERRDRGGGQRGP